MPSLRALPLAAVVAGLAAGCGANPSAPVSPSAAIDTTSPYPLDRGASAPGAPATYKELPLSLADNGEPAVHAVDGLIGMVCIGMSNAAQECADFVQRRQTTLQSAINPEVVVVNCAVGGRAIEDWIDPASDAVLWDACIGTRLPAAGLSLRHVKVVYHKAANEHTTLAGGAPRPAYPDPQSDWFRFRDNLGAFAARVRAKFPAVEAVYTSSRSYGGFAGSAARGEPLSYEEGLALDAWLRANPRVDGAWYGWGPYLWAPDCATGIRNGSEVCYVREDYVADGVHPARGALDKVTAMLHARLLRHGWYRR